MKYENKDVDLGKGIVRITTSDERWYQKTLDDGTVKFVPSVTWLCEYYPKGIGFYRWLAEKGWDEAQAIKELAGSKGSVVHQAIQELLDGRVVKIDSKFGEEGGIREITAEEYLCVMSFADWFSEAKPEVLDYEFTVWNDEYNYAGTCDLYCKIKGVDYIIDFKTSANIYPSHELQLSAYKHALNIEADLAILQIGYQRNKKGYKFTEIEDQFDLFLGARKVWEKECKNIQPLQRDFPLEITLKEEANV